MVPKLGSYTLPTACTNLNQPLAKNPPTIDGLGKRLGWAVGGVSGIGLHSHAPLWGSFLFTHSGVECSCRLALGSICLL